MITQYKQQKGLFTFFKEQQELQSLKPQQKPKHIAKHKRTKNKTKIKQKINKQSYTTPFNNSKQPILNNLKDKFLKFIIKNYQARQSAQQIQEKKHNDALIFETKKHQQMHALKIKKRTQQRASNSSLAKLESMETAKKIQNKFQEDKESNDYDLCHEIIFNNVKKTKLSYLTEKNQKEYQQRQSYKKYIKQKIKNRLKTAIETQEKGIIKLPHINIGKIKKMYTQSSQNSPATQNNNEEVLLIAYPNNYFKNHVSSVRTVSSRKIKQVSNAAQSNLLEKNNIRNVLQPSSISQRFRIEDHAPQLKFLKNSEIHKLYNNNKQQFIKTNKRK